MDKQEGLASIQEDQGSSREARLNCQERSSEAFYPPSSPPKAFFPSSANEDEEREVAFPSILATLKRSQNSRDESLLTISSSDLSNTSSGSDGEGELERGGRSLPESPESNNNKEEVFYSFFTQFVFQHRRGDFYSCVLQVWKDFESVLAKSPVMDVTDQQEVKILIGFQQNFTVSL